MNSPSTPSLSRKEWYAALLFAHGATPNESANALFVHPSKAEQLVRVAREKLGAGSRSQVHLAIRHAVA